MKPCCENCTYWVDKEEWQTISVDVSPLIAGWCTARPPTVGLNSVAEFPGTRRWMVCGSWQNRDLS